MRFILLLSVFTSLAFYSFATTADSSEVKVQHSVLVVPYMPAMHLSDTDTDLSEGSHMEMPEMRETLRQGIIKSLNKKFAEVYDVHGLNNDFVKSDNRDMDVLYHTLQFEGDSTYPFKYPAKFAIKDSLPKKKGAKKIEPETFYMNVGIHDEMLVSDLSKKYDSDYIIFLNEIDIKTHFDDCINLAMKIYRREIKIHYSIFDKTGKQLYGDAAVSNFGSNSNDVNKIIDENFPTIADYILKSFNRAVN